MMQVLFAIPLVIVIVGVILSTPHRPRNTECRVMTEAERKAAYLHRVDQEIGLRSEEFAKREAIGQAAKDQILTKIRSPYLRVQATPIRKPWRMKLRTVSTDRKAG